MGELAVKRRVVQGLFHGWIGQTEPLLQEVNSQHGLDCEGRAAAFDARAHRRERLDQTHQFSPRNNQAHLIEKHTLARALSDKLESAGGKADLFHVRSMTFRSASLSGFCRGSLTALKLSKFGQVVVGTKVSKSGNALPQRAYKKHPSAQTVAKKHVISELFIVVKNHRQTLRFVGTQHLQDGSTEGAPN